jgi:hypothetical protein
VVQIKLFLTHHRVLKINSNYNPLIALSSILILLGVVQHRYEGKGGHHFQLPHEVYEHDALELGQQIHDTLEKINKNIHAYSLCITKYYQDMGVDHVFIKRLRDEIAFNFQVSTLSLILQLYRDPHSSTLMKGQLAEFKAILLYWPVSHCQLPSLIMTKMHFSSMYVIKSIILVYI